jgi:hypothetical protein
VKRPMAVFSTIATAVAIAMVLGAPRGVAGPVYEATLLGRNEIPPNNSPGTGLAHLTLVSDVLNVLETFNTLTGPATLANLHCCTSEQTSTGVAVPFPSFPNAVAGTYTSAFDLTNPDVYDPNFLSDHGGTASGAEAALIFGLERRGAYSEIYTMQFPRGEIRGFLVPVQVQIPEPASLVLLGPALLGLGLASRLLSQFGAGREL